MKSSRKRSKNRIRAVDFARGLSVIWMIMIHTMLIYGNIHTQTKTDVNQLGNICLRVLET